MSDPVAGLTVMTGSVSTTFEITAEMVGGAYCMVRQIIQPHQLFWPHVHAVEDQTIIVVTGRLGVRIGDREFEAGPGEVVFRPKGVPHTVWNAYAEPVEILEITSPGVFDRYFAAQGEMTRTGDFSGRSQLIQAHGIRAAEGWEADLSKRHDVKAF